MVSEDLGGHGTGILVLGPVLIHTGSLYSIGTSDRSIDQFFEPLVARAIVAIVDVRSRPGSRLPHFRKAALSSNAEGRGMMYSWEGDQLGGLNESPTDTPSFIAALDRLMEVARSGPTAIFCAEGDPARCHRSWKVGAALLVQQKFQVVNILRDGRDEPITRTLLRTRGQDIPPCLREGVLRLCPTG